MSTAKFTAKASDLLAGLNFTHRFMEKWRRTSVTARVLEQIHVAAHADGRVVFTATNSFSLSEYTVDATVSAPFAFGLDHLNRDSWSRILKEEKTAPIEVRLEGDRAIAYADGELIAASSGRMNDHGPYPNTGRMWPADDDRTEVGQVTFTSDLLKPFVSTLPKGSPMVVRFAKERMVVVTSPDHPQWRGLTIARSPFSA